ncbi:MAG: ISKra4 family transposase [Clostridiaceae bacterium]|nr:ISKra4 family transposase [Clostridiaceae bacterium]
MENNTGSNKAIAKLVNECESVVTDFSKELKDGLEEKKITIDNIEMLLLKTISTLKTNLIKATEEIVNESALKKKEVSYCEKCGKKHVITSKSSNLVINSMLGELNLKRPWLFCRRCGEGYSPLDRELEVNENYKVTKALVDLVCDFAQMLPFQESSDVLNKHFNINMASSTIQKISEDIGKKLYLNEKKESDELYNNQHKVIDKVIAQKKKGKLYIECDGSMVAIRGDGWREVKLGIIFSDLNVLNKNKPRHIISEKDYVAYLGTAEEFKKMLWASAVKNGCLNVEQIIFIGDGAQWIWNMVDELFPDAEKILDFYHFTEHVHDCGMVLYEDDKMRETWVKDIIDGINDGFINETLLKLNTGDYKKAAEIKEVKALKTYLENNKERMNYKEYKEKGYFVGSGAVEGGNKCVIQQRLKLSGMRWSKEGAQYIATLRSAKKSKKWEKVKEVIYNKCA